MVIAELDLIVPTADFELAVEEGVAPLEVAVDASGASTPEGTGPLGYRWDFGDGNEGEGMQASHVYTRAGVYEVTLQVANEPGVVRETRRSVTVGCPSEDLAPWLGVDIGDVRLPGAARDGDRDAGCLGICAGGESFSGDDDAFYYVHQVVQGDQRLEAEVTDLDAASSLALTGLMLRESLDPGARYAAAVIRGGGQVRLYHRSESDGRSRSLSGGDVNLPAAFRIERAGDEFIASHRPIGAESAEWKEIGRVTLAGFSERYHAGVAATAAISSAASSFQALEARVCNLELGPVTPRTSFLRGDCNSDGDLDIADATCVLDFLFAGEATPGCLAALNANGDDEVNLADAVSLLNDLFADGPAPPAPFPDCGPGRLDLGCAIPPDCPRR